MLADVRTIISQQLGTDLDKVRRARWRSSADRLLILSLGRRAAPGAESAHASATPSEWTAAAQVAADSKFADLGADSLDTVRAACGLRCGR